MRLKYPTAYFPFVPAWALTYEQKMLDSWIGFLVERANNVGNYYFDGIQSKGVG